MKMFITGGAGFIGSHLVDLLLEKGHSVKILVRPEETLENVEGKNIEVVRGDVCDRDLLMRETPNTDIIYHLAARTDLDGTNLEDYRDNIEGTRAVVEAAEHASVKRLVFYSSMLATSMTGTREPIDETRADPAPNRYGESKRLGEAIVLNAKVPTTVIRPTMVYGPRERSTMRAYFNAIRKGRFFLIGPDVWQSFCFVKNLVEGTYQASLSKEAVGEVFFISDVRPYTLREFSFVAAKAWGRSLFPYSVPYPLAMTIAYGLLLLRGITGIKVPLFPSRVRTMTTNYVYSIEKARRTFNYNPPYSLEDALRETAAWYLSQAE